MMGAVETGAHASSTLQCRFRPQGLERQIFRDYAATRVDCARQRRTSVLRNAATSKIPATEITKIVSTAPLPPSGLHGKKRSIKSIGVPPLALDTVTLALRRQSGFDGSKGIECGHPASCASQQSEERGFQKPARLCLGDRGGRAPRPRVQSSASYTPAEGGKCVPLLLSGIGASLLITWMALPASSTCVICGFSYFIVFTSFPLEMPSLGIRQRPLGASLLPDAVKRIV